MKRISEVGDVQIVGTLSRGWFQVARDNLDALLSQSRYAHLHIYLLDPFGIIWRGLIASDTERHSKLIDDGMEVFRTLHDLASRHPEQCEVHLYDTEPMSFVKAAGRIYLGLYLPRMSRKEVPEFTISEGSFLGRKIQESADKLMKTSPTVPSPILQHYRDVMLRHARETRHEYWSDPEVTCDFCKEFRGVPSTFTRKYSDVQRITVATSDCLALPSLGPLVPNHALLLPRNHATSVARLSNDVRKQMAAAAGKWAAAVSGTSSTPLLFEHGTPSDDNTHGGCGICHCHVHLVPLPSGSPGDTFARLSAFLASNDCPTLAVDLSWEGLDAFADEAYLAVQPRGEVLKVVRLGSNPMPSQLLRRFVAEELLVSQTEWDWRDEGTSDDANEKQQIVDCHDQLNQLFADS
jgi:diadenosine tetraphosphate (Ap4A) HIT family hydrolase